MKRSLHSGKVDMHNLDRPRQQSPAVRIEPPVCGNRLDEAMYCVWRDAGLMDIVKESHYGRCYSHSRRQVSECSNFSRSEQSGTIAMESDANICRVLI
jgi:hypothetical protein